MSYAENNGVRIHYRVLGAGKPLVLHHGFTESIEDWLECGYVDALQSQHRLILIDARGHGRSDKPHDPSAYSWKRASEMLSPCLMLLGSKRPTSGLFHGWMGRLRHGSIRAERVDRLVIGGQHPFAQHGTPSSDGSRRDRGRCRCLRRCLSQDVRAGRGSICRAAARRRSARISRALTGSAGPRPTAAANSMPCCLYVGGADDVFKQARSASQRIPGAIFFLFLPRSLRGLQQG